MASPRTRRVLKDLKIKDCNSVSIFNKVSVKQLNDRDGSLNNSLNSGSFVPYTIMLRDVHILVFPLASVDIAIWHLWSSGRALDLKFKGPGFDTQSGHVHGVIEQGTSNTLLSTG